jgi:hypothetical protein
MNNTVTDLDARRPPRGRPINRHRRLSDQILSAFHVACDQGELEAAVQLLAVVELMLDRPLREGHRERREGAHPLVAARTSGCGFCVILTHATTAD